MKLLKYFFYLMILSASIYFLIELNELNKIDGEVIHVKIPFLVDTPEYADGFNVWIVLLMTFTVGVVIGFVISLFQVISQKSDIISLRSKNKRVQLELDGLRNQGIDDEIDIADDIIDDTTEL